MSKVLYFTIFVNCLFIGLFAYLGLGPLKLWKHVFTTTGAIDIKYLVYNILLVILLIIFIITSISLNLQSQYSQSEVIKKINSLGIQTATLRGFELEVRNAASDLVKKAETYFKAATYEYEEKHYDAAISNCEKSIEVIPTASAYLNLSAYFILGKNDSVNAEKALLKGIKIAKKRQDKDNESSLLNNLGSLYAMSNQHNKAIDNFSRAIELNPQMPSAYYNRGISYKINKQYDKSLSDSDKCIKLGEKNEYSYFNRGFANMELGNIIEAIDDFTESIKYKQTYAEAYYNRANGYIKNYTKNKDNAFIKQAISDYSKAIIYKPDYTIAFFNRGLTYATDKNLINEAIADFTKVVALNPKYAEAYYNRGVALKIKGDLINATVDFRKACDLGYQKACLIIKK